MSLTKLAMGGNNLIIPALGMSLTFFYGVGHGKHLVWKVEETHHK
jgi:hypothetical protein